MKDKLTPLVVAHGARGKTENSLVFITPREEISMDGHADEIINIIRRCNGQRSIEEIATLSGIDTPMTTALVRFLIGKGVLRDSRELYLDAVVNTSYPLVATYDRGPKDVARMLSGPSNPARTTGGKRIRLATPHGSSIGDIAALRHSSRGFRKETLSPKILSGILSVMYRNGAVRPIPSAGGLYPLGIYVLQLKQAGELPVGLYAYDPDENTLVLRREDTTLSEASTLLDSPSILKEASAVIFITADIDRSARKYANRAYRYVLLEAGHAAQNAYLYCAESDVGIVEYGGFNDEAGAAYLGLCYPRESVLISLVIGVPDREASNNFREEYTDEEWALRHAVVGDKKPITALGVSTYTYGTYRFPRYVGWASYASLDPAISPRQLRYNRSTGVGLSMQEATLKAMAEAFERYCSGLVRVDREAVQSKLDAPILDLCADAPLREEYLERACLSVRDPTEPTEWVRGLSVNDNQPVYLPIDQVFYPLSERELGRKLTYVANSTGIAAHHDPTVAFTNGLYELLERDAIAVHWYSKWPPKRIARAALGRELGTRVENIERALKREVHLLDLTIDSVPIIACMLRGESHPCTTSGFGCSPDAERAVAKALDEAEVIFHTWRRHSSCRRPISETQVYSVVDHLRYWGLKTHQSELDWLLAGEECDSLPMTRADLPQLIRKFRPVQVDLTPKKNPSGLKVLKVGSPLLMPITFGYMSEHYGHPRLQSLGYEWGWAFPALPHFLA